MSYRWARAHMTILDKIMIRNETKKPLSGYKLRILLTHYKRNVGFSNYRKNVRCRDRNLFCKSFIHTR